jgi:exodeoxyribonuclease-3
MKIVCWNVAGIRGSFKKGAMDWLSGGTYDIVCIQETKATEEEADKVSPRWVKENYPHRYWNSCTGEFQHEGFQKKGLSGTCIWSKQPGKQLAHPGFDKEGRTTTVEFSEFIIVTVYTPNSQTPESNRFRYRVRTWDDNFREYIQQLNALKPTIVCGDFNVAHGDGDVYKPVEYKNMVAGFMNEERDNFSKLLDDAKLVDTFRRFHPDDEGAYTFWDQKLPYLRRTNRGWRIDYFLTPTCLRNKVTACDQHPTIRGSDHCPITLELTTTAPKTKKRKIKLRIVENFE